jgi:putative PIN family toxin of toxin-antitoxin system
MQRIVLDTNCLLQILPSISPYHEVWNAVLDGRVSLCVNTEILEEYEEIIGNKTTPEIASNIVEAIARLSTTYYQESYVHFGLIEQDVDDNKFVDCAIASDAEYIVSNDAHFKILQEIEWPKVEVLLLEQYYSRFFDIVE